MSTQQVLIRFSNEKDPNKYLIIDYYDLSAEIEYRGISGDIIIVRIRRGHYQNQICTRHRYDTVQNMWRLLSIITHHDIPNYTVKGNLKINLHDFFQKIFGNLEIVNKNHQNLTKLLPRMILNDIDIICT